MTNVLWLGKGIAGDDTHGHVDDLCRFVGPRTVRSLLGNDPHDANYSPLQENWERVRDMRLEDGSKLEVVPLAHAFARLPGSPTPAGELCKFLYFQCRGFGADLQ